MLNDVWNFIVEHKYAIMTAIAILILLLLPVGGFGQSVAVPGEGKGNGKPVPAENKPANSKPPEPIPVEKVKEEVFEDTSHKQVVGGSFLDVVDEDYDRYANDF